MKSSFSQTKESLRTRRLCTTNNWESVGPHIGSQMKERMQIMSVKASSNLWVITTAVSTTEINLPPASAAAKADFLFKMAPMTASLSF